MTKKNTANKVSAVDAIKQPFQYESKSTQTHSPSKEVRLGGVVKTVSVLTRKQGQWVWESQTRVEGGQVINASHRVRTGKTKRERSAKVRDSAVKEAQVSKKKK